MSLTGNKGEWSEIYAFLKLLADGKIHAGDGHLKKYENLFFPIIEILRSVDSVDCSYKIQEKNKLIHIDKTGTNISVPQKKFIEMAKTLLGELKDASGTSLHYPEIEKFLNSIHIKALKAPSKDKTDIRMVIHDLRTGMTPKLGFSIKSKLGGSSTLLNSNKDATNFQYLLSGVDEEIACHFNSLGKFQEKFDYLFSKRVVVTYDQMKSSVFQNNLVYIDSSLPKILAESVLTYYSRPLRTMTEIINKLEKENPLNFDQTSGMDFYTYKIKQFLVAYALGMTASTRWDGKMDANGGYIVVKEDGDILCYHCYDKNEFEDYLFRNTKFETPSTNRHNFGSIFLENDNFYLKLNIQVRFIH